MSKAGGAMKQYKECWIVALIILVLFFCVGCRMKDKKRQDLEIIEQAVRGKQPRLFSRLLRLFCHL